MQTFFSLSYLCNKAGYVREQKIPGDHTTTGLDNRRQPARSGREAGDLEIPSQVYFTDPLIESHHRIMNVDHVQDQGLPPAGRLGIAS